MVVRKARVVAGLSFLSTIFSLVFGCNLEDNRARGIDIFYLREVKHGTGIEFYEESGTSVTRGD